jgi:hypothetical protein
MQKRNSKRFKDLFNFEKALPGISPVAEMINGNNDLLLPVPPPKRDPSPP